jgi:hypothetical protein
MDFELKHDERISLARVANCTKRLVEFHIDIASLDGSDGYVVERTLDTVDGGKGVSDKHYFDSLADAIAYREAQVEKYSGYRTSQITRDMPRIPGMFTITTRPMASLADDEVYVLSKDSCEIRKMKPVRLGLFRYRCCLMLLSSIISMMI